MKANTIENSIISFAAQFINTTNRTIFLTGKAGTGKTTFLKYITKHTYKNTIIAAPTGIAAINAGGVTLHSLFQLPFGAYIPSVSKTTFSENQKINNPISLLKEVQLNTSKRKLLQELELLIIDEVSMLRADLLDAIDTLLRSVRRKNNIPFGGVQLLFIGDLLQLPPVIKDNEWNELRSYYNSIYFFEAHALKDNPPLYIELNKIYRQADDTFIGILNNLRNNQVSKSDIEILNQYYKPDFKNKENYIQLTTHNHKADSLNKQELQKLNESSFFFKAETKGDFNEYAYPIEQNLELKKGAQIMFIKNDPSGAQRFFNGKIGKISKINSSTIEVEFQNINKPITVDKYEWQNIKYTVNEVTNEIEEKIVGTYTQYPIKLAWAITIHKSQGLTFEKAIVDIESAFAPGQVYVALSRLTSLNGLVLSSPINFNSLSLDSNITTYSSIHKSDESILPKLLEKESQLFYNDYILNCFNLNFLNNVFQKHLESYSIDKEKSVKKKYFDWAVALKTELNSVKSTADKFLVQLKNIIDSGAPDYKEQLQNRVISAKNYFYPLLKEFSKTILKQIEKLKNEKRIKAYLSELAEIDSFVFKQIQLINKAEILITSAINKTEYNKEESPINAENKERLRETINSASITKRIARKDKNAETEKKIDSKQVSYNLYKQNKTIESIAKERGMAQTTIESHLSHYVSLGLINAADFVEKQKMENIITVSKKMETTLFSPIKQALGDEYSYSEIKFAMAYYLNSKK